MLYSFILLLLYFRHLIYTIRYYIVFNRTGIFNVCIFAQITVYIKIIGLLEGSRYIYAHKRILSDHFYFLVYYVQLQYAYHSPFLSHTLRSMSFLFLSCKLVNFVLHKKNELPPHSCCQFKY